MNIYCNIVGSNSLLGTAVINNKNKDDVFTIIYNQVLSDVSLGDELCLLRKYFPNADILKSDTCIKCFGVGKPSKAYINTHNIQTQDANKEFETKLIDCIKCENCGHSWK